MDVTLEFDLTWLHGSTKPGCPALAPSARSPKCNSIIFARLVAKDVAFLRNATSSLSFGASVVAARSAKKNNGGRDHTRQHAEYKEPLKTATSPTDNPAESEKGDKTKLSTTYVLPLS